MVACVAHFSGQTSNCMRQAFEDNERFPVKAEKATEQFSTACASGQPASEQSHCNTFDRGSAARLPNDNLEVDVVCTATAKPCFKASGGAETSTSRTSGRASMEDGPLGERMATEQMDGDESRAAAASACSSNGARGFCMEGKSVVRISPALLGHIGEAAKAVVEGSLIVQFAGRSIHFNEDTEWHVTHAILSNSLAVSSHEMRAHRNQQVDDVMRSRELAHIGWLRQASVSCPLSSLDLDTQRVYEEHLSDSFAAMLDMAHPDKGPMVYFYCLANPSATASEASYNAFAAAHHVVLDTSVPFYIVEVSLEQSSDRGAEHVPTELPDAAAGKARLGSGSGGTDTTNGEAETHEMLGVKALQSPEDDCVSMSLL